MNTIITGAIVGLIVGIIFMIVVFGVLLAVDIHDLNEFGKMVNENYKMETSGCYDNYEDGETYEPCDNYNDSCARLLDGSIVNDDYEEDNLKIDFITIRRKDNEHN